MNVEYSKALAAAQKEMDALIPKKFLIDARIAKLKATIETLTALCDRQANGHGTLHAPSTAFSSGIGLTEAVRTVLYEATRPMKAPDIRDAMKAKSFDTSQYTSELTVVHNTIKRLLAQGEIEVRHDKHGIFIGWVLKDLRNSRTGQPGDVGKQVAETIEAIKSVGPTLAGLGIGRKFREE